MFKIILPDDYAKLFKTPLQLMDECGYIDMPLNLNPMDNKNQWDLVNNEKLYRKDINPILYGLNFLQNNICSNVYLYQNVGTGMGAPSQA